MPTNSKHYVVVLPDGTEHFGDVSADVSGWAKKHDIQRLCEDAVRKAGITSPRKDPVTVRVEVHSLVIEKGELKRRLYGPVEISPHLERMTEPEFNEEMDDTLRGLPEEFHPFIRGHAWETGHAYGYEEVINHAEDLVSGLSPCVVAYRQALLEDR